MAGSFIPFAKTRAEREKSGGPRLSIKERYPNRADYLRRVQDAANWLVEERFVLPEHVRRIVEEAGQHWDWMMAPTSASAQRSTTAALGGSVMASCPLFTRSTSVFALVRVPGYPESAVRLPANRDQSVVHTIPF